MFDYAQRLNKPSLSKVAFQNYNYRFCKANMACKWAYFDVSFKNNIVLDIKFLFRYA